MKTRLVTRIVFISVTIFITMGSHYSLAHETMSYSDTEFLDADWSAVKITDTTVGQTASYAAFCSTSSGNPGAYRHVVHDWCGDGTQSRGLIVGHLQSGATYDPAQFGPILSIDASFDAIFNPRVNPNAVGCGPLVVQDGHYFRVYDLITAQTWTTLTFDDLTEVDFICISGGPNTNPDFSAGGAPLQFGFITQNGTGGSSCISTNSGYDNWLITITHQSTPVNTTTWGNIRALYRD